MKLYELYGPEGISVGQKPVSRNWKDPKTEKIGVGGFAVVFDHPTRPGSVIKVVENITNPNTEAQVVFTSMSIENKDNPYFPRIYQAKLLPVKKLHPSEIDKFMLVVEMEKLQPITGKKARHLIPHIFEQTGVPMSTINKLVKTKISSDELDELPTAQREQAFAEFDRLINNWETLEMMTKYAQNPAFKQAMAKIEEWAQMFSYDLHAGNWMFRLTQHGPQLVILDPYK